jgi:orotidine-5'-phosphate decarboxylase
LCRTSNKGADEFQDVIGMSGRRLFKQVAMNVSDEWNANGNCSLVVGATYPEELKEVRQLVGTMPILIPGIGAQGGDVEKTVKAGKNSQNQGMIINSSRGILYASSGMDFAEAARRETENLHHEINKHLS